MTSLVRRTLFLLAVGSSGCSFFSTTTQSNVDVPTTLEAVRALARPPEVVVAVERKERTPSGGNCGHSPLCVIILPVIAYEALFPEKWDAVTITDHDAITYDARFATNGDFLEATVKRDGTARTIGVLALKELHRREIVELGRAPLDESGKAGAFVRSAILPQVDLAALYRAALIKESDAEDRADLFYEYASWLNDEALPLFKERVPAESDEGRARLIEGLCSAPNADALKSVREETLDILAEKPGPKTAAKALSCTQGTARAEVFARALAVHVCDAESGAASDASLAALLAGADHKAIAAMAPSCAKPNRRVFLLASCGASVDGGELRAALASDDVGSFLAARMRVADPEHRAAIFDVLEKAKDDAPLIAALANAELTPDARELRLMTARYAAQGPGWLSHARDEQLLDLFARAKPRDAEAERSISDAIAGTKDDDRPRLRIALVVLGARDNALAAARGLGGRDYVSTTGSEGVVAHGLMLAGCESREVIQAGKRALSAKDGDRGALCTKP